MPSVLDRSSLEQSPLADLHLLANELGVDGFRRLRKPELVDAILARQSGEDAPAGDEAAPAAEAASPAADEAAPAAEAAAATADVTVEEPAAATTEEPAAATAAMEAVEGAPAAAEAVDGAPAAAEAVDGGPAAAEAVDGAPAAAEAVDGAPSPSEAVDRAPAAAEDEKKPRRGRRGGRGRSRSRDADPGEEATAAVAEPAASVVEPPAEAPAAERVVEGVVELLSNGSGFVRLTPPDPTDDDVYVSAAQVKRCELVSGDKIAGPVRAPRRSERFPSLVRVDTINGRPAEEVAEGTHFENLPVAWPTERIELGTDDPTTKAIEWLTPFGKGSRVTLVGPARAGKTEALRRIAGALAGRDGLEVTLVLAGVRPEEGADWVIEPEAVLSFAASADAQAHAIEQAVEQGRRVAARGGDAVLLIDGFEYVAPAAARRALAAARNLEAPGSLTIIATATAPVGGESTVVALDPVQAALGRFPALDLAASGTLRPELLVGDGGAEAIRAARAEQLA